MVNVTGENRWENLANHLKSKGFALFSPGVKVGECKSPYLVLTLNGSNRSIQVSSDIDSYLIMIYVPQMKYSSLESEVQKVKEAMKEIRPMFIPQGVQTPSFYDDSIKAHMVSIEYVNYKKL